jgi:hypothetical protein
MQIAQQILKLLLGQLAASRGHQAASVQHHL